MFVYSGQKHLKPLSKTVVWKTEKLYSWNSFFKKGLSLFWAISNKSQPEATIDAKKNPIFIFYNCWKILPTHPNSTVPSCFLVFFLLCSSRQPVNHPFDQEPWACSYMRNIPAPAKDPPGLVIMQPECASGQIGWLLLICSLKWLLDHTQTKFMCMWGEPLAGPLPKARCV